jgi:uncharacterized protein (TIGR02145 family)
MKYNFKFIVLILITVFFSSCKKNETGVTEIIPIAPVNLSVLVSANQITLDWTDNSTNETGFKIERKSTGGVFSILAMVGKDITTYRDNSANPATTYTYRVYSYNSVGNSLNYSNEVSVTAIALPVLSTITVSNISDESAISGGNISSDAGSNITARGVVWDTAINPTVSLSTKTTNGQGTGNFQSSINGLLGNTTYYLRAYATNSAGTAYGNTIIFTTQQSIPANLPSVTICNQIWQSRNLDVTTYRDGTPIPEVTNFNTWKNLTTGAWCYYGGTSGNNYGKLYNWYAIMGIHDNDPNTPNKILAPKGWHISTENEWITLQNSCLGGTNVAGGHLKATTTGTTYWTSPNTGATNSSGFNAFPGGERSNIDFDAKGLYAIFWTYGDPKTILLSHKSSSLGIASAAKYYGNSVRCVKD